MGISSHVFMYQTDLNDMSNIQFEYEILKVLSLAKEFINIKKADTIVTPFYDIEANQIVEDGKSISVGFCLKKVHVLTSDIIYKVADLWSRVTDRKDKLILISVGSIPQESIEAAEKCNIELWNTYDLFSYRFPKRTGRINVQTREENLSEALRTLSPGKLECLTYQQLSCDIFSHLFVPPLEPPRFEMTDTDGRNRRDMIFENSTEHPYWKMLRGIYKADYIVIDAKNYSDPITKQPIIDIAHYLKSYGCGLFGIILTRKGADGSALHAIKEQWTSVNKMILVLDDDDLLEMLRMKSSGKKPEELIRVKIADFRMSL